MTPNLSESRELLDNVPAIDNELSALEYARQHQLCTDYTWGNPLQMLSHENKVYKQKSQEDISNFEDIDVPISRIELNDKLIAELQFLASCVDSSEYLNGIHESPEDCRELRSIISRKIELPLLNTEDELDMLHFGKRIEPNLGEVQLAQEPLNIENDEQLDCSFSRTEMVEKLWERLRNEKLHFPRSVLLYLSDIRSPKDLEEVHCTEFEFEKMTTTRTLTSPLLPNESVASPFEIGSSVGQIEPLSDITGLTEADEQMVQNKIAQKNSIFIPGSGHAPEEDMLLENTDDLPKIYSPMGSIVQSPPIISRVRTIDELKAEVPLTPQVSSRTEDFNEKSFSRVISDQLPDTQEIWPRSDPHHLSSDSVGKFFVEVRLLAEKANDQLAHERLEESDTLLRVVVPVVDFARPRPPWKTYCRASVTKSSTIETELEAQSLLLKRLRQEELALEKPWPGVRRLESSLPWTNFASRLGQACYDDRIENSELADDIATDRFIVEFFASDHLTWKQEGLRLLDEIYEEEDNLEPGDFEDQEKSIELLTRKRKLEMDEGEEDHLRGSAEPRTKSQSALSFDYRQGRPRLGTTFSASNALDSFLRTRGEEFKKGDITCPSQRNVPDKSLKQGLFKTGIQDTSPEFVEVTQTEPELPFPSIPSNAAPRPFVISTAMLQTQRGLFRQLEALYPAAQFIERDYLQLSATVPFLRSIQSSSTYQAHFDPTIEADIALSPACGLVLTNLRRIIQRSLPGEGPEVFLFRERLRQVSMRYERVVVLVSQGVEAISRGPKNRFGLPTTLDLKYKTPNVTNHERSPVQQLGEHDSIALSELTAFGMSLEAEILVTLVPGGERELAKWTVSYMNLFGVPDETSIPQLESNWEQFLRRAGMNVFAALRVLGELNQPIESSNWGSSSDMAPNQAGQDRVDTVFGLSGFLRMSPEERIDRFEELLEGKRVLQQVNSVLEKGWLSESTGFSAKVI